MMDEPIIEQKEKIKLKKMSKGYNWEISLFGIPEEQLTRLKKINNELENNYQLNSMGGLQMSSIKEAAQAYESKQTKNITDLEVVRVDAKIKERTARDKDQKEFTYNYIIVNGEEYRVPDSVLKDLKVILEAKPELTSFQVKKTGTGMNTKYTVIPLA